MFHRLARGYQRVFVPAQLDARQCHSTIDGADARFARTEPQRSFAICKCALGKTPVAAGVPTMKQDKSPIWIDRDRSVYESDSFPIVAINCCCTMCKYCKGIWIVSIDLDSKAGVL